MDQSVPAEAPPGRRGQRIAVIAAAVLVIALGGVLYLNGGPAALRPSFGSHPSSLSLPKSSPTTAPSPSPTPPALLGAIPSGQPIILYRRQYDPDAPHVIGVSWAGSMYSGPDAPMGQVGERQSPDGSKILIGLMVYDVATGSQTRLQVDSVTGLTGITWADDSEHLCTAQVTGPPGSPTSISIMGVDSPPLHLATLGTYQQQIPGPLVLACSALTDRVVVVQFQDPVELWVLDARTGAIEYHRTYPASTKVDGNGYRVLPSRDGRYIAEMDTATAITSIRRVSDDSIVTRLSGDEVLAFSWKDDLVLAAPRAPDLASDNTAFQDPVLIDLGTGQTVWHAPSGARFFGSYLAQPQGEGLALDLNVCALGRSCTDNLWLVNRGGKSGELDHDVHVLWDV